MAWSLPSQQGTRTQPKEQISRVRAFKWLLLLQEHVETLVYMCIEVADGSSTLLVDKCYLVSLEESLSRLRCLAFLRLLAIFTKDKVHEAVESEQSWAACAQVLHLRRLLVVNQLFSQVAVNYEVKTTQPNVRRLQQALPQRYLCNHGLLCICV